MTRCGRVRDRTSGPTASLGLPAFITVRSRQGWKRRPRGRTFIGGAKGLEARAGHAVHGLRVGELMPVRGIKLRDQTGSGCAQRSLQRRHRTFRRAPGGGCSPSGTTMHSVTTFSRPSLSSFGTGFCSRAFSASRRLRPGCNGVIDHGRRPPRKPPDSAFSAEVHAAPPQAPREFNLYSKCRGQIDVVGATGLEPATPCSQSRCATTAPRPDAL